MEFPVLINYCECKKRGHVKCSGRILSPRLMTEATSILANYVNVLSPFGWMYNAAMCISSAVAVTSFMFLARSASTNCVCEATSTFASKPPPGQSIAPTDVTNRDISRNTNRLDNPSVVRRANDLKIEEMAKTIEYLARINKPTENELAKNNLKIEEMAKTIEYLAKINKQQENELAKNKKLIRSLKEKLRHTGMLIPDERNKHCTDHIK